MGLAEKITLYQGVSRLAGEKRVGVRSTNGLVCDTHANDPTVQTQTSIMSGAAICLDYILKDFAVNALSSKDATEKKVFVEYRSSDGVVYQCDFDGTNMIWENNAPGDYGIFLPVLFHALTYKDVPQLKQLFDDIVDEVNNGGITVDRNKMFIFCDSFYYDALLPIYDNTVIIENSAVKEPAKRAFINGIYEYAPVLEKVEAKPIIQCIANIAPSVQTMSSGRILTSSDWDDVMGGKYKIPFQWSEKMASRIPSPEMMKEYYPVDKFFRILNKVNYRMNKVIQRMDAGIQGIDAIKNDYINITLSGNPGTGKTISFYNLAAATGLPICTVPSSKNTDEDTYEGKNKFIDGQVRFVETDFLNFYQNGGIILLEEVNLADPGVTMGALGQAVEFPFVLMKDGYEAVRRHPLCIICSTKNINTYGSRGVNQAFSNRFVHSILLDDPTDDEFVKILMKKGFPEEQCAWVHKFYKKTIDYLLSPEIGEEEAVLSLSMRTCIGALQNIEEGMSPKAALEDTFMGKIAETNKDVAINIKNTLIRDFPITF